MQFCNFVFTFEEVVIGAQTGDFSNLISKFGGIFYLKKPPACLFCFGEKLNIFLFLKNIQGYPGTDKKVANCLLQIAVALLFLSKWFHISARHNPTNENVKTCCSNYVYNFSNYVYNLHFLFYLLVLLLLNWGDWKSSCMKVLKNSCKRRLRKKNSCKRKLGKTTKHKCNYWSDPRPQTSLVTETCLPWQEVLKGEEKNMWAEKFHHNFVLFQENECSNFRHMYWI